MLVHAHGRADVHRPGLRLGQRPGGFENNLDLEKHYAGRIRRTAS